MSRVHVQLGAVQETLLVPLLARAAQARTARPILDDPHSAAIADRLDYDFRKFNGAWRSQVGCLMRSLQFDAWAAEFLAAHPAGTVVELGAGLNTRFERLDNGRVHWLDLDLPDSMALRRQFFADSPRRVQLAGSVLERDWLDAVRTLPAPYLFISEAVLVYLPLPDVRRLLCDLATAFPGSGALFDLPGRKLVQTQERHDFLRHTQARLAWSVDSASEVESWCPGLKLEDAADMQEVGRRYHTRLPIGVKLMGLAFKLLRPGISAGYTLARVRLG